MTEVEIKLLKARVTVFKNFIKKLDDFVKNDLPTATLSQIRMRRDDLVSRYTDFLNNQSKLEILDEMELQATTRTDVEEYYYNLRPALEDKIDTLTLEDKKEIPHPLPTTEHLGFIPKLPDLVIEKFSGDIIKWQSFIESFNSHVHDNARLTTITKFQYLKNALIGPASKIIESLDFSAANYDIARRLLTERYNRPSVIAEEHIRAIFEAKPIDRVNSQNLLELLDEFNSHLRSLNSLGRPTEYWGDLLVYLLSSKFDFETKMKWRDVAPANAIPSFEDISSFIKNRSRKLDGQQRDTNSTRTHENASQYPIQPKLCHSSNFANTQQNSLQYHPQHADQSPSSSFEGYPYHSFHASKNFSCMHCKLTGHTIMRCYEFISLSKENRLKVVQALKLCLNCLRQNHTVSDCLHNDVCRLCSARHHTLIHTDAPTLVSENSANLPVSSNPESSSDSVLSATSTHVSSSSSKFVYLTTALVHVYDRNNATIVARAVLDSGSQLSLITKSLASKLDLNVTRSSINVHGIGGSTLDAFDSATVNLRSMNSSFVSAIDVHILPHIADNLPSIQYD